MFTRSSKDVSLHLRSLDARIPSTARCGALLLTVLNAQMTSFFPFLAVYSAADWGASASWSLFRTSSQHPDPYSESIPGYSRGFRGRFSEAAAQQIILLNSKACVDLSYSTSFMRHPIPFLEPPTMPPSRYACGACEQTFCKALTLRDHANRSNHFPWICPLCDQQRRFFLKTSLESVCLVI